MRGQVRLKLLMWEGACVRGQARLKVKRGRGAETKGGELGDIGFRKGWGRGEGVGMVNQARGTHS